MPPGTSSPVIPIRELLPELMPEGNFIPPASQSILPQGFPQLPALPEPWRHPASDGDRSSANPARHPASSAPPRLRDGCYLAEFHPVHPDTSAWPAAQGTLRWEQVDDRAVVASGDWYRRDHAAPPTGDATLDPAWTPGSADPESISAIPSFPRDRYHAYFQIGSGSIVSSLGPLPAAHSAGALPPARDAMAFAGSVHRLRSILGNVWQPGVPVIFHLLSASPALDAPNPSPDGPCDRAKFYLTDATGAPLGELRVRWISPFFRDAVVEIDTEPGLPAPVDNGKQDSWETAFARVGWRIRCDLGTLELPTPPSGRWTYGELHEAMIRSRQESDVDAAWRYHVSVVRSFADPDAPLGIAFDHEAMDLNGIPREGVALYAGARLPDQPVYGRYAGRLISECPDLFFHIALHEVGHAMGLYHNHVGFGVMDQIDDLAMRSRSGSLTPETLEPRFSADDILRLRHLPDIHVRPGGTDFETVGLVEDRNDAFERVDGLLPSAPRAPTSDALRLHLTVSQVSIPVGAPIRVDFHLVNRSDRHIDIPSKLGLSTPFVRGWMTGPDGSDNAFRSLYKTVALPELSRTRPGMAVAGSLTLLRGHRGALAARPGHHALWIEIAWICQGEFWCARQFIGIDVLPPESAPEARAVRRLLRTPETLGYLVLGRIPSFQDGETTIDAALEVPRLRPHFAFIQAKALSNADSGPVDWERVRDLLASERHTECLNRRERDKSRRLTDQAVRQIRAPERPSPAPTDAAGAGAVPKSTPPPEALP